MTNIYTELDLVTESDVEQKFVYKLLTTPLPMGLGYSDADFRTKPDIRKLAIDKGDKRKLYYPDYVIIIDGVPSVIIEVKAPNEDLTEAIREARLYATEINSEYKNEINPCSRIIVTNGVKIIACYWEQNAPHSSLLIADIDPLNPAFDIFLKFVSKTEISIFAEQILKSIKKQARYFKPVYMLGGKAVINESVGDNSFGANVSLEYKYLFNPDTLENREAVVTNAYVPSRRKQSHVAPIDKIIRAALPSSHINSKPIEDTAKPKEIIDQLCNNNTIKNELCLLIGSVGSGKSTFTDYLRIVALPENIRASTEWININLNMAPLSRDLIYNWVISKSIERIKINHADIDFDDINTIKKIYNRQLVKLSKGRLALYPKDSDKYIDIIHDELRALQSDDTETFDSLIHYLYGMKNKLLVIVLDNCDKRDRSDQLLMFEVATWLKDKFACMIFLPLRDSTYDQYCNVPPLDTVIKDLVFRIDPPFLEKVIYARLNYVLREISGSNSKFNYYLPNNVRVECDRSEVGLYLKCIVGSLFQNNFFKRIITGLAGRNIREGLEILLDFAKSGHISTDEIFKIRQSEGDYKLSTHLIARILLRGKRKYYSDEHSHIRNLFYSEATDSLPDPFVRVSILRWLKNMAREFGPNKTKGYHKVGKLIMALQAAGHAGKRILNEIETLSSANCIFTETQGERVTEEDLIAIAPSGFIHLDLLRDISYLQAVSEDTNFRENQIPKKIADNLVEGGRFKPLSRLAAIDCSSLLIDYLVAYHQDYFLGSAKVLTEENRNDLIDIKSIKDYVDRIVKEDPTYTSVIMLETEYSRGTLVMGQIVSVKPFGFFIEFGLKGIGLIHSSNFNGFDPHVIEDHENGNWVIAEIIEYDHEHQRFQLKLIDI